jgi:hypothetical protein
MADEPLPADDPLHWTGREQTWNFMCALCHSTGLVRGYGAARDRYATGWTEISVGCESCHGPAAAHVAWARARASGAEPHKGLSVWLKDRSGHAWRFAEDDPHGIARREGPPRQSIAAQVETCGPCHARTRRLVADPLAGAVPRHPRAAAARARGVPCRRPDLGRGLRVGLVRAVAHEPGGRGLCRWPRAASWHAAGGGQRDLHAMQPPHTLRYCRASSPSPWQRGRAICVLPHAGRDLHGRRPATRSRLQHPAPGCRSRGRRAQHLHVLPYGQAAILGGGADRGLVRAAPTR